MTTVDDSPRTSLVRDTSIIVFGGAAIEINGRLKCAPSGMYGITSSISSIQVAHQSFEFMLSFCVMRCSSAELMQDSENLFFYLDRLAQGDAIVNYVALHPYGPITCVKTAAISEKSPPRVSVSVLRKNTDETFPAETQRRPQIYWLFFPYLPSLINAHPFFPRILGCVIEYPHKPFTPNRHHFRDSYRHTIDWTRLQASGTVALLRFGADMRADMSNGASPAIKLLKPNEVSCGF
ncbi:hypothetical protein DFS33DRAFT_1389142 [Desarmillaria ectypa]|nr:hypothetical protein DFS33DRAFT_1389142 [Desarmillaria ectypa]